MYRLQTILRRGDQGDNQDEIRLLIETCISLATSENHEPGHGIPGLSSLSSLFTGPLLHPIRPDLAKASNDGTDILDRQMRRLSKADLLDLQPLAGRYVLVGDRAFVGDQLNALFAYAMASLLLPKRKRLLNTGPRGLLFYP
jgi:hypothetical protein